MRISTIWQQKIPSSVRRGAQKIREPLFVGQVFSSLAGSVPTLLAAAILAPPSFVVFSLLTLLLSIATGFSRAALFRPALITQRSDRYALVPFRYGLLCASLIAIVVTALSLPLGVASSLEAATAVGLAVAVVLLYEWARSRFMAHDLRRWVAVGDGIRFVLSFSIIPAALFTSSPVVLILVTGAGAGVALLIVVWRLPRLREWTNYLDYFRQSVLQAAEYVVSQMTTTVPLLVLGALAVTELVGAIRLSQTLFGPMNLLFSAVAVGLLADGATRDSHRDDSELLRRSVSAGRSLIALGSAMVVVLLAAAFLLPVRLDGVSRQSLLVGIALVGSVAVLSGWAGIQAVMLRLVGAQLIVTLSRIALVIWTWMGFAVGLVVGGPDASLTGGFVACAVGYPLLLGFPGKAWLRRRGR